MDTKPETLLFMPVKGKYCEVVSHGTTFNVWRVNPNTPTVFGTAVPYDVGVYLLLKTPPIVTLVPKVEGKKFVSQILPEDQKQIAAALARGFTTGLKNYNSKPQSEVAAASGDNAKLLGLLEDQMKKNKVLEDSLAALVKRLETLESVKPVDPVITPVVDPNPQL